MVRNTSYIEAPLLTRDKFRENVFARDGHKCVICGNDSLDAHHILERRLWTDGGYYLDNGASVCETCHVKAEQTLVSCDELRTCCGIDRVLLPEHLYRDQEYDKWGNPILPNGTRLRGELFCDESVQKILEPVLHLFSKYVKYPRTYHLPWSENATKDDRILSDTSCFEGKEVVVTVKMDGECTTIYNDYVHARSLEYNPHPSRDLVKALQSRIGWEVMDGWRICGENLVAKHSIHYQNLNDFFLVFSLWNDSNVCQPWNDTVEYSRILNLKTVPVLYQGVWDESKIRDLVSDSYGGDECEGYVVRLAGEFHYKDFRRSVAKFVRRDHVRTHGHWMRNRMELNKWSSCDDYDNN